MDYLKKFFEETYKENHIKEISSAQFADILRKYVFNKMPMDNKNAGLDAMNKMVNQIHNKHYQRSDELGKKKDNFGGVENVAKVIKTPDTHLHKHWQERFHPLGWIMNCQQIVNLFKFN